VSNEPGDFGAGERKSRTDARPAQTGSVYALTDLLEKRGESAKAHEWARQAVFAEQADLRAAVEAGDPDAMHEFARLLFYWNAFDEAQDWYRRAAEAGQATAMFEFGQLLYGIGSSGEALEWFLGAAEAGVVEAMVRAGSELERRGDLDAAGTWFRRATAAGDEYAAGCLARVLELEGKPTEPGPGTTTPG
jgi:TPR repeat protein